MTDSPSTPRGTPPNRKQMTQHLGAAGLALYDAAVNMGTEFGATWRWAHSEATGAWTYRAYMPGERFLMALSLADTGFEASLNLKPEEWEWIHGERTDERAVLDALRDKAIATGDSPAWLHVPMASQLDLSVLAKLLFARGRRVEAPRRKKRR